MKLIYKDNNHKDREANFNFEVNLDIAEPIKDFYFLVSEKSWQIFSSRLRQLPGYQQYK